MPKRCLLRKENEDREGHILCRSQQELPHFFFTKRPIEFTFAAETFLLFDCINHEQLNLLKVIQDFSPSFPWCSQLVSISSISDESILRTTIVLKVGVGRKTPKELSKAQRSLTSSLLAFQLQDHLYINYSIYSF